MGRPSLTDSEPLVGRAEPRLWTPPARELTPETSLGFECIDFAHSVLGMNLFPWQEFFLTHALELNEDGSYRFNTIMLIVARQNGKTELLTLLSLWKPLLDGNMYILGTAQSLDQAGESWNKCVSIISEDPDLLREMKGGGRRESDWVKRGNGPSGSTIYFANGARYRIASTNRRAGRGKSVDTLFLDELREQQSMDGWAALSNTTMARPNHQKFLFSNAGDLESKVYNHLRAVALSGIEGEVVDGEDPVAIFEWSAPDDCDPEDESVWPMANPSLNVKIDGHYTITTRGLRNAFRDQTPEVFKTENLCMSVDALDAAVDLGGWTAGTDPKGSLTLAPAAFCLDVAPDARHVALVGAQRTALGRVWVEVINTWSGPDAVSVASKDLRGWIASRKPKVLGWFPTGPGAPFAALLGKDAKPLPGVVVRELTGTDVTQVCMSFAQQVQARKIGHKGDALLNRHVTGARKLLSGDGWRFSRREDMRPVNAAYAAAGAVHLARTLKAPAGRGEFFAVK
jgi:hypothetical protein